MGKKTTINESSLGSLIVRLAVLGGAAVMRVLAPLIFQTLIRGIARTYYGVKDMVAPEKWLKFVKKLEKSNSFNIEFIKFLKERFRKGSPKTINSRFVDDVLNLPAFVDEFNKFVKDEEIADVEKLRSEIRSDMESSFRNNLGDIYKFLKKTYPELTTDLEESLYMFEAKHTKGGIYKGKLKIGGVPVPVEVEMVGADNRTRSYLVRVIHIDKQYWSKLPKDGIIPIPSRIFDIPGGGWAKLKTPSVFENQKYYDKLKEIETMVTELLKKRIKEDWTNKYKKSIDCNNPKGFSQKAHCAGRNARQRGEDTKSNSVK